MCTVLPTWWDPKELFFHYHYFLPLLCSLWNQLKICFLKPNKKQIQPNWNIKIFVWAEIIAMISVNIRYLMLIITSDSIQNITGILVDRVTTLNVTAYLKYTYFKYNLFEGNYNISYSYTCSLSFMWDPSGIASTPFSSPVLLDASLRNIITLSSGKYSGSHRSWSSFSYTNLIKQCFFNCQNLKVC